MTLAVGGAINPKSTNQPNFLVATVMTVIARSQGYITSFSTLLRRNISIGIPLDLSIPTEMTSIESLVTGEERGHEVYRSVG